MKKFIYLIPSLIFTINAFAQEQEHKVSNEFQSDEILYEDSLQKGLEAEMLSEMDALLDLWYIQKQISSINMGALNDSTEADCLIDEIVQCRMKDIHKVIPLAYNQDVRKKI
jgi:hypothetical protein